MSSFSSSWFTLLSHLYFWKVKHRWKRAVQVRGVCLSVTVTAADDSVLWGVDGKNHVLFYLYSLKMSKSTKEHRYRSFLPRLLDFKILTTPIFQHVYNQYYLQFNYLIKNCFFSIFLLFLICWISVFPQHAFYLHFINDNNEYLQFF